MFTAREYSLPFIAGKFQRFLASGPALTSDILYFHRAVFLPLSSRGELFCIFGAEGKSISEN